MNSIEVWKPVIGYEGLYEVSDQGRVRSLDRVVKTSRGQRKYKGRILKPSKGNNGGHLHVDLYRGGAGELHYVHRLVLGTFIGPCPEGFEACHNDGNPAHNALKNLRWDTRSGNILDSVKHGTHHHAVKSHCKNGHGLYGGILVPSKLKQGKRECLVCHRATVYIRRHDIGEADHWKVRDMYLEKFLLEA